MDTRGITAVVIMFAFFGLAFWFYRAFITHARRETFRWMMGNRSGQQYHTKPMRNSGWFVVGLVLLVVVLVVVAAS